MRNRWLSAVPAFALLVVLGLAGFPALAQSTGAIEGTVADSNGSPLPGVSVDIKSHGAHRHPVGRHRRRPAATSSRRFPRASTRHGRPLGLHEGREDEHPRRPRRARRPFRSRISVSSRKRSSSPVRPPSSTRRRPPSAPRRPSTPSRSSRSAATSRRSRRPWPAPGRAPAAASPSTAPRASRTSTSSTASTPPASRSATRARRSTTSSSRRSRSRPAATRPSTARPRRRHQRRHQVGRQRVPRRRLRLLRQRQPRHERQERRPTRTPSASAPYAGPTRYDIGADLGGFLMKDRIWFWGGYNYVNRDRGLRSMYTGLQRDGAASSTPSPSRTRRRGTSSPES